MFRLVFCCSSINNRFHKFTVKQNSNESIARVKRIEQNNETVFIIDGICPFSKEVAAFGITQTHIIKLSNRGATVRLTHLLKIVDPGLIIAQHVFRGLKRPLQYGEDLNGDASKLIYSWKPDYDYDWPHAIRFEGGHGITERSAPPGQIFVVIATPNEMKPTYPAVDYWIESNWTWVEESKDLAFAPIECKERYDERLDLK